MHSTRSTAIRSITPAGNGSLRCCCMPRSEATTAFGEADRAVLGVGQAESQDQVVSWNQPQCGAIADLCGHVLLPARGLHQIPDEIPRINAGSYAYDRRCCNGTAPAHRYPVVQRAINQKGERSCISARPIFNQTLLHIQQTYQELLHDK